MTLFHKNNHRLFALVVIPVACCMSQISLAQPGPDRLHGVATLSSNYILNGLSQTDGGPSLRLSLDFEHASGFFAGGVLANVEFEAEAGFSTPRDTQIVLYTGYVWRRGDWMSNLTLSRYDFPGIERDYDYTQTSVNVSFRERFFLTRSRSSSHLSIYGTAEQYSAGLALPVAGPYELGASAGRFRSTGPFEVSYSYWDIGISRRLGPVALDLRFHANTYPRYSLLGNDATDLWVLSMTYPFRARGKTRT